MKSMIIVLKSGATASDITTLERLLADHGLRAHVSQGEQMTIIGVIGDKTRLNLEALSVHPAVERLVPIASANKLSGRQFRPQDSWFELGGVRFGGGPLVLMAGPCAVESYAQLRSTADAVKAAGATVLRGGAYKPRTSPYAFQGLEKEGLRLLRQVADETGLLVISEVMSEYDIEDALRYVDLVQVGARNAQNFRLLAALGRSGAPVLLKRGIAQSIEEWLGSAEYVMNEGNYRVLLCERGIRTFETATRNTLDISAVPVLKEKTHLPVFVDPSHAAGKASLVPALARAAVAAGCDGLIIEVHPNPAQALSDAAQQLTFAAFRELAADLPRLRPAHTAVQQRGDN